MKQKLPQFDQHFEKLDSTETPISDTASELELEHYMYLYRSERSPESQSLEVLGKEPFVFTWINRPARYLETKFRESCFALWVVVMPLCDNLFYDQLSAENDGKPQLSENTSMMSKGIMTNILPWAISIFLFKAFHIFWWKSFQMRTSSQIDTECSSKRLLLFVLQIPSANLPLPCLW